MDVTLDYAIALLDMRWKQDAVKDSIPGVVLEQDNRTLIKYAHGEGSGLLAEIVYHKQHSGLTSGATDTIDLMSGTLMDAFGNAFAFNGFKAIVFKNVSNINFGGGGVVTQSKIRLNIPANPITGMPGGLILDAGGSVLIASPSDGYVVDATHRNLAIENLNTTPGINGTAKYSFTIFGTRS